MKILTIVGARPQFIKAAAVSREILKYEQLKEVIIHTGQHFDKNMSDVFFEEMDIPKPDYNLNINSLTHGAMTGRMLEGIEKILLKEKPGWVLVYGDTNSTLAGALAASKLHIKVAHVEAGLRSFNTKMPEEINRILTDRISNILFCPTEQAIRNLENEGYDNLDCKLIQVGDVMQDAAIFYESRAVKPDFYLPKEFVLATIHRAENTDDEARLTTIINSFNAINEKTPIVLPLHPRTRNYIAKYNLKPNFTTINPIGYLGMIHLLKHCSLVMTDSGGLQKEAYFFKKPCITLRAETEWVELIERKVNFLCVPLIDNIEDRFRTVLKNNYSFDGNLYGGGKASNSIVNNLLKYN